MLPEEIVNVEVWAWTEKRLYTQQKIQLENEKALPMWCYGAFRKTGSCRSDRRICPNFGSRNNATPNLALGFRRAFGYLTSEGTAHKDLYAVDLRTGQRTRIVRDLRCNPRLSPDAGYIVWWSDPDSAWFAWNAATGAVARMTDNGTVLLR